jgi:Glycosyltransferase family 87
VNHAALSNEKEKHVDNFYIHLKKYSLIYLGLVIYLLFFISVAWTGWFDAFFSGAALHAGAKGIDFYQLPRGAWAFWHGGSLTGDPLANGSQYAKKNFSNGNVYHPLFTLTLGSFLALFDPARSPYIWLWIKLFISLPVIGYFFCSFRTSRYIDFAVFILLANFSIYLELAAWQFHFVLNMLLLLFLIMLVKKRQTFWSGFLYCLGMLVKPVGLLFVPMLLCKGRWKIVLFGIGLFVLCTVAFLFHGTGKYYTDNLVANLSSSGTLGPNQIITFQALLRYTTHWPDFIYQAIQNGSLFLVVFLSMLKRIHISKAVFLYIAYYLCFYEQVFEYQWSSLAYVLAVCVVTCPEFQTRFSRFCILLTCLPGGFILLNHLHIDVKDLGDLGLIPGATAWEWMVVSKLIPLFLLLVSVLAADLKPIFKQIKAFSHAIRKANDSLDVFGDEQSVSNVE